MSRKLTTEQFIEKAINVHGDKYCYKDVKYILSGTPVKIRCKKHGIFEQRPFDHLKGGGCMECYNERQTKRPEQFIIDAKKKHGDIFIYDETKYTNCKTPVKIKCRKHGIFKQTPSNHLNSDICCPECRRLNQSKNVEDFILDAEKINKGKYQYDEVVYISNKVPVIIKCKKHGNFEQRPDSHLHSKQGCPKCANDGSPSKGELDIAEYISKISDNKIKTNVKIFEDSNMHLDLHLPKENVGIEFNGLYWHSDKFRDKKYHVTKTNLSEEVGVKLFHIFEHEWYQKREIIESILLTKISPRKLDRLFARKCEIRCVDNKESKKFCEKNHIQGHCGASVKLGLYYNGSIVSMMTFSKPRFSKKYEWEMVRFCNKLKTTVVGGASKLWKHFIRTYNPDSVVSYSDRRYFDGSIYPKLGFEFINNSDPNYFYFNTFDLSRVKLESRNKYQKHKLKNILEAFDPNKTEKENMSDNGFNRIWDSGNSVWVYKNPQSEKQTEDLKLN